MASAIDPDFITPSPVSKSGMRTQLATARDEITELQDRMTTAEEDILNITDRLPVGIIFPYAGSGEPVGYLFCAGQTLERAAYPELFAAIGTTYNDGSETGDQFGLPDLRGRTIIGKDNMGGTAASRITSGVCGINGALLGAAGGSQSMQQHTHTITVAPHTHTATSSTETDTHTHGTAGTSGSAGIASSWTPGNSNNYILQAGGTDAFSTAPANSSHDHDITVASATATATADNTGNGAAQNVQPSMVLNWIIKANGLASGSSGGSGGGGGTNNIIWEYACSTETDELVAGVVFRTRTRQAMNTMSQIRISLNEASTSGGVEVDVKRNGTSVFSTLLTIDQDEKTSVTAAVPAVLSTTEWADDDEVEVEITDAGTGAAGLKIAIIGGNN